MSQAVKGFVQGTNRNQLSRTEEERSQLKVVKIRKDLTQSQVRSSPTVQSANGQVATVKLIVYLCVCHLTHTSATQKLSVKLGLCHRSNCKQKSKGPSIGG